MLIMLLALFLVTMFLGTPIAFSMSFASIVTNLTHGASSLMLTAQQCYDSTSNLSLLAVPFFMLAGSIMNMGGISRRLINFCRLFVGRIRGGLAIVAVLAAMIFAAISGSGPATVAALGVFMIPAMVNDGYDVGFAGALMGSAGGLGIIIPPSIPMVIYATLAGCSVGTMFCAGFVPGIILGLAMMIYAYIIARRNGYKPAPVEHKQVYGITFEQGRNELTINADTMLTNWVTENKSVTEEQKRDLIIALITLKYTQSNSVCYTAGGQTIGVGAGQQSRIHCTRLAGQKADNWQLRHMDKVLNLPFRDDIAKPNRDNAIDVYIGDTPEDVIGDDVWAETFTEQPAPLTAEEKKEYLSHVTGVCLGSDAFFPFGDNIERARRSGVTAIVQPGGSIRDQQVIDTCNKYGIAMAFCGIRLFHH